MDRLPPLAAVRVFEAAGRHENFSRAAQELGMTQAAVSYQVRQLEDRVGRSLFVRERGRVRLSEAGQRLLPALTGAFSTMAEAFSALRIEDEDVLSLDTFGSLGSTWLSSRIGRFQLRHPDLALRVTVANELVDLVGGTTDVALRGGTGHWPGLRAHFLFRQHFTPMCTPSFREAHGIRAPEDLLRVERLAPNDDLWARWFEAAGVATPPPRGGVTLDSQLQEASALSSGYGIAMMSPLYWRAEIESGRFVQPFDTIYYSPRSIWLVHSAARIGVRKIERLREWLTDEISADRTGALPAAIWELP